MALKTPQICWMGSAILFNLHFATMALRVFFSSLLALLLLTAHSFAQSRSGNVELVVEARLIEDGPTIESGLIWRVYPAVQAGEELPDPVAMEEGGTASFTLPAGVYIVHAGYGRAAITRRVDIQDSDQVVPFVLHAGGLQLTAEAEGRELPGGDLRFTIYDMAQDEDGDRRIIARNVSANSLVRLNEGTYHVVSRYGTINASVRADLEVTAGKVTRATLQQRGARIALKLVSKEGGDPVANTAWTVLTDQGEKVFVSNTVSPSLILAEGAYEASVRNGSVTYVHNFEVKSGEDRDVEVLLGQ